MNKNLTTQGYWESYYKKSRTDKNHIIKVCSYYDTYWHQLISEHSEGKTIVEIGGFPGRYLAYLSSKFNLIPTCLDYNSDIQQIEASFHAMGLKDYRILQDDFTKFKPQLKYDFVLSNGFIEHFVNLDEILDLHIQYMNSNGRLYIMIPNMRGYIRLYKYFMDYDNLKIHNLDCMSLKIFKNFATRHHLKIIHLSYYGGFPYNVHQKINFFQKIIYKAHQFLFKQILNKLINKYPSPYFSSSIIAIFEKD